MADSLQSFLTGSTPGSGFSSTSLTGTGPNSNSAANSASKSFNDSLNFGAPLASGSLDLPSVFAGTFAAASGVGAESTEQAFLEFVDPDEAAGGAETSSTSTATVTKAAVTSTGGDADGEGGNSGFDGDPEDIDDGIDGATGAIGGEGDLNRFSKLSLDWDSYVDPSDPVYLESDLVKQEGIEFIESETIVKPMITALGAFQQQFINQMRRNQAEEQQRVAQSQRRR